MLIRCIYVLVSSISKVYWLDEGGSGVPRKVASVNMDGSNPQILVRDDLFSLGYLALNMEDEVLYWSEGGAQKVPITIQIC